MSSFRVPHGREEGEKERLRHAGTGCKLGQETELVVEQYPFWVKTVYSIPHTFGVAFSTVYHCQPDLYVCQPELTTSPLTISNCASNIAYECEFNK
jgi:hypothetical protein